MRDPDAIDAHPARGLESILRSIIGFSAATALWIWSGDHATNWMLGTTAIMFLVGCILGRSGHHKGMAIAASMLMALAVASVWLEVLPMIGLPVGLGAMALVVGDGLVEIVRTAKSGAPWLPSRKDGRFVWLYVVASEALIFLVVCWLLFEKWSD